MKNSESDKWQASLTEWSIVLYPEIYDNTKNSETVFAKLNCGRTVALFGRAKDDPRLNAETGAFTDGHRLITSPIIAVEDGKYHTIDTIYILNEETKNAEFKKWCEENRYKEVPLAAIRGKSDKEGEIILRHICECCGEELTTSSEEANAKGWDYPPKMGTFKIVSPRTCGACRIQDTLWWEITQNKTSPDLLSERHQQTLRRILNEPESIMP